MKKLLLILLCLPLLFTTCKKEDDTYTTTVTGNNTTYSIEGVWETTYANLDGTDALTSYSHAYEFFWPSGEYGSEGYDLAGNLAVLSFGTYSLSSDQTSLTYQIDYLDNDGDNNWTNGENININIPFNVTKFDNSNFHINTWNILVDGASVFYSKRLEKTNMSLPPL